jgi:hypothetical protein
MKFRREIMTKKKLNKRWMYITIWVFLPVILLYLLLSFYYNNHFYYNSVINGVSASNMNLAQAEEAINTETKSYLLKLEGRKDVVDHIYGDDIDLRTVFDGSLENLLDEQNGFTWIASFFRSGELKTNTMIEYDESLLEKKVDELSYFDEKNIVEPVNASISTYGKNGYEIVKEDPGAKVSQEKLYKEIKKAVDSLAPSLSLEKENCYEEAEITSKHPDLVKALNEMNKIAQAEITYEFGEDIEILDGDQISQWIFMDDDYKVTLKPNSVKEYVDYIGKTYNSFGRVRTFQTSYGKVLQIRGGDYGWWLDRITEVSELTDLILNGEQLTRKPVYFQTAQQYGPDDIGDTYVELNLTAQHLFLYKDGKLVLESDFVSGNIARNKGTPVGTYPIQYKENDAILNGEDYSTPVKYWMPFNGSIGMHDASWRNEFGKKIYLTNGSHGCINMPPAAAKKVFENVQRGVAVVVYELEIKNLEN